MHSLCMGIGVRTALFVFTQLSSVTEGFKLCWRTGQKLTLKPSFFHHISRGSIDLACSVGQWVGPHPGFNSSTLKSVVYIIFTFTFIS